MLKKTLVIALIGLMVSGVAVGLVSLAERSTPSGGRGQAQVSVDRADLSQGQGRGQRVEVSEGGEAAFGDRNFEAEHEDCDCEDCTSGDGYKGQSQMPGSRGAGQGSGRYATEQATGAGQGVGGGGGKNSSHTELVEQLTVESTVVSMGEHIVIKLADGTELELGMGPTFYREEIGFSTEVGAELIVTGFHEDGEFKVLSIVDGNDTESIFRDEYGRPGWAGRGNRQNSVS